jgi:hypothetical protein
MKYLVNSQKHRRVEEILYDHNTENMRITIKQEIKENSPGVVKFKPVTYRRKEIILSKKLKAFSVIFVLLYILLRYLTYAYKNDEKNLNKVTGKVAHCIHISLFPLLTVILITSWFEIFSLMRKRHRYEFEKSRK